jgi:hypothetical protein
MAKGEIASVARPSYGRSFDVLIGGDGWRAYAQTVWPWGWR